MADNPDRKLFNKDSFVDCETKEPTAPEIAEDLLKQGLRVNLATDGLMNTSAPAPFISFNAAMNEKVISNSNAYIVLGQDRPADESSGQGGQGAISDTIDLVVGRMASAHGGKGPCDGMFVGNSPAADAARIYISRSTKVDKNFGIMRTAWENSYEKDEPQRSAIAVKADKVRIIGRSGVKIVTGGMQGVKGYGRRGETDSFGYRLEPAPSIDLIAGNYTGHKPPRLLSFFGDPPQYIEPIARGYQTRDAFDELSDIVDHLMGLLFQSELLTSTCFSAMGAALSPLSAATGADATARMNFVSSPSYNLRQSMVEFKFKFLDDQAPKAVWSRNVNST
jgi:hypothetical protein